MEKDLIKFYDKLKTEENGITAYEDDLGNYIIVALKQEEQHKVTLLCSVQVIEFTEKEKEKMLFDEMIEKNVEYEKVPVKRVVNKKDITHKDKDKNTLIDIVENGYRIYVVKNNVGLNKTFSDKNFALDTAKKLNDKVIKEL